jgi:hypothetical protein
LIAGNLYLAELGRPRISVLSPDDNLHTVAEDDRWWGPDATIIINDRYLYAPIPQTARVAGGSRECRCGTAQYLPDQVAEWAR